MLSFATCLGVYFSKALFSVSESFFFPVNSLYLLKAFAALNASLEIFIFPAATGLLEDSSTFSASRIIFFNSLLVFGIFNTSYY